VDDLAVTNVVFVEHHGGTRPSYQFGLRSLALLDWQPAQILAVKLDQVEGTEHRGACSSVVLAFG
jgi:hypothetical protein